MIPPTSIDGTDITGATIDGTDVTEITIDGDTVFSAEAPIPSSAIHRFKIDEGSGTTLNDDIGSYDGTINGASFISGNFQGGFALKNNGTDTVTFPSNSIVSISNPFSYGVTFEVTDPSDFGEVIAHSESATNQYFGIGLSTDNDIYSYIRDGGTVLNPNYFVNTNEKVRCLTTWDGSNNLNFYVDKAPQVKNNTNRFPTDSGVGLKFFELVSGGSGSAGVNIDDVIFYNSELTTAEIEQDYDAQPWT